jgi:hypothetical protein
VGAILSPSSHLARVAGGLIVGLVLLAAAAASVVGGLPSCGAVTAPASATAERTIPAAYATLYRQAGAAFGVPWPVLAAIGAIETDHGRSLLPGVQSGVNDYGCCAGPMQFNLRDGPPSTWQSYRVDGDRDGRMDPYDPADAIASAAHYLQALLEHSGGDLAAAVFGYNHSPAYVADVLARARAFSIDGDVAVDEDAGETAATGLGCAGGTGSNRGADLQGAEQLTTPRAYAALPASAMAAGRPAQLIDARLLEDALWLLRTYGLRVMAAREGGHNTHGDGTALDLVPAKPVDQAAWDQAAGALARDLGWTAGCARSGSRPACPLVPAIQFVGYDGYPNHGSPRTCRGDCPAHLHVSWVSPCYGTSAPSAPCAWVRSFTAPRATSAGARDRDRMVPRPSGPRRSG